MRIATIATRFSTGGAQLNSLLVANELAARGHRTQSWFLMRAGELDVPAGLEVKIASESPSQGAINSVRCMRETRKFTSQFEPDVIIGFHPLANIIGASCAYAQRHCHFIGTQRNPSSSQGRVTGLLERLLGSTSLYAANVAVTSAVCESYSAYPHSYRNKLRVIHNGTPDLAPLVASKAQARASIGLPAGVRIVGTLGRLAEQKNPLFLLDVCRNLPDVHLAFAGSGPLRESLLGTAEAYGMSGRVHLTGELRGEHITSFYKSIDAFLLPSLFEGFGRTLVEAMSLGVPVVAHALPVTHEVVGDAGFLLPLTPELWSAAINELASSPTLTEKYSLSGTSRADLFTVRKMIDGYEKICMDSLAGQARHT